MATACLNRVSAALKTSAAVDICLEPFRSVGKLDKQAAAAEYAPACLDRLRDLLKSKHGIRTLKVENKEIARFVEDAETKDASSINAKEYQDLMEHVMKYSALKARRSPRRRFTLGVMCSAASAVAITAVTAAASTGVLVAAAPVGAAVGALAVGASSLGASKRDKKRAVQHTPPTPANTNPEPTTSAAAEEAAPVTATKEVEELITVPPTTADDDITPATPPAVAQAVETAADDTPVPPAAAPEDAEIDVAAPQAAPELDGAEAPVAAPAEETAALETQLTPFSAVSAPFPSHSGELSSSEHADAPAGADTTSSADASPSADVPADYEAESQPLPELLRCPTPEHADSDAAAGDSAQELLTPAVSLDVARSADLPPMPKKKKSATKKIKKSLSKGYKSFKKAMSINSSNDLEAAAAAAVARADKDVLVAPTAAKPPSGFSFRRSFSRDSARDMNGEGLSVQGSEGSATLKKMKELLRRSFTISPRTSMDLGQRGSFDISDRGTKAY